MNEKEVELALAAKKLMDEGVIQNAFRLIEANMFHEFKACAPTDTDGLHLIKLQLHALNALELRLRGLSQSLSIEGVNINE